MSNKSLVVVGLILLVLGLTGLGVLALLGRTALQAGPLYTGARPTTSDSLGEQIYYTGRGTDGPITRSGGIGRMGSGGCVTCHGADGRGGQIGMMSSFADAPAITYDSLTGTHDEHDGEAEAPWTDTDIARAIRSGVEPDGRSLDRVMPRWDMSDTEMDALIQYLKTL